jgi:hypothetical protein
MARKVVKSVNFWLKWSTKLSKASDPSNFAPKKLSKNNVSPSLWCFSAVLRCRTELLSELAAIKQKIIETFLFPPRWDPISSSSPLFYVDSMAKDKKMSWRRCAISRSRCVVPPRVCAGKYYAIFIFIRFLCSSPSIGALA